MALTSLLGKILLLIVLASNALAIVAQGRLKFYSFIIGCLLPSFCFILLIFAFLNSDFNIRNVFLNSSSTLPIIYKLAASFASHEGSMLLWNSFLGIVSFIYIQSQNKLSVEVKNAGMAIFAFIGALFTSFIIFTSNPFDSFSFTPTEGLGLNPMLQDVALIIHPPILYFGNLCYAAIFTSGLLILYRPQEKDNLISLSKKFSSCSLMFLTIGIGLGSWWAYRELGWGGFWFFDPVENISLLPWLSGIALHHFLIIYKQKNSEQGNVEQRNKYLKWIIILSILSFLLIIFGTFIVRSGIISSVHSFAFSPERGLYIFTIFMILTISSFGYFLLKHKNIKTTKENESTKELLILLGNIFWLISLTVLVIALIYPIYCSLAYDIDVVIDPEYFYNVFVPIFIPIIFLAAITPYIGKKLIVAELITIGGVSVICVLLLSYIMELSSIFKIICLVSIFLIFYMVKYILIESHYFSHYVSGSKLAIFLSHFGFGMLCLTITLNCALSYEVEFTGKIGNKIMGDKLNITLEDVKFSSYDNYYRQIAVLCVEDKNNNKVILKPENRLYKIEKTLSQEVDIFSFLFYDLYAVLSKVDKDIIHAKVYYQPFISFIWFSIFTISLGFSVSWIMRLKKSKK